MKVALFSDVHGHLRLLLHLLRCWQMGHGTILDGALVAGDLGCFPDASKLDKATRKYIEHDPEEAGFSAHFTSPKPDVQALIDGEDDLGEYSAVKCPVLFVAGNHEDYGFLGRAAELGPSPGAAESTFPVDCYRKFLCLKSGKVSSIKGADGTTLRVAGLWGIEKAKPGAPYVLSLDAALGLMELGMGRYDLLLTHDAVFGAYPQGRGSSLLAEVLKACDPPFHVFGHVHPVDGQHEFPLEGTRARSIILNDVSFGKDLQGTLDGAMAILDWDGKSGTIEIVTDDWLCQMRHNNWQYVVPG